MPRTATARLLNGDRHRVDAALRRIPLPEHAPDFWERVAARLPASPGTNGHPRPVLADRDSATATTTPTEPTTTARTRRRRPVPRGLALGLAVAAVTVVAIAGAVALVRSPGGDRVETGTSDAPTDQPTTTTAPGSTAPTPLPGSEEAVLAFLDALGNGDLAGAASRLGTPLGGLPHRRRRDGGRRGRAPQRRRGLRRLGGRHRPDDLGRHVRRPRRGRGRRAGHGLARGCGRGAGPSDPRPLRIVRRDVARRAVRARPGGYPVRGDRPGSGSGRRLRPGRGHHPGPGTAWLAVDDQAPAAVRVGADATASWTLAAPLPPGRHTLTVAFVSDTVFEATTVAYDVTEDGAP